MTVPTSSGRDDATLRGAVVLVVAIVIGLALLARGGSSDDESSKTTADERDTTEDTTFDSSQSTLAPIDSSTTSAPEGAHSPQDVTVIVLNGIPVKMDGAASGATEKLTAAGYAALTPTNANTKLDKTTIYSDPDFAADAAAIRGVIGMPDAELAEKPTEPLGAGAERADVVVVLGGDYSPQ